MATSEKVESVTGNIWVPPGKVRSGKAGDILFTSGVGACIEVGIFDAEKQLGHMAHIFSTYGSQQSVFSELEQLIHAQTQNSSQLMGWVIGGSSEANMPAFVKPEYMLRNRTIANLGALGLVTNNLSVEWNDSALLLMSASLDCATGEHKVATKPVIAAVA